MTTVKLICPKCESENISYRLVGNAELEITCKSCGYFDYGRILTSFKKSIVNYKY